MTAEKVIVDADLWEWLVERADHTYNCIGADYGHPDCGCGFTAIARRLHAAVPVVAVERSANAQWWRSEP